MDLVFGVALCVVLVTALAVTAFYLVDRSAERREKKGQ
jgi:hypothetical protein